MFDFRIANSGFAGLIYFISTSNRAKTKLKQFLHNKVIYLDPREYVKNKVNNLNNFS